MKRNVLICAAAAVAVLAAGSAFVGGDTEPGDAGTVTATLADAGSLEEGNAVRSAGVPVGQISEIRLDDDKAVVTLDLEAGVLPLHRDASLKVRPVNLLGENFVDLNVGSDSEPFMDKQVIPESRTESAVTLQDFLSTFQDGTAAGLANVVTTLGEGVQDSGGELAAALRALAPAMGDAHELGDVLSAQNEVLDSLVAKLDPVAGSLATGNGRVVARLVRSTERLLSAITADRQALEDTLVQLPSTLRSARVTLSEFGGVADSATPTLKAIRPITDDLSEVTGELRTLADVADPALASLKPVLEHAQTLLDEAAPVVAGLRNAGPDLASAARSLRPIGRELLDEHLGDVMAFVRKWALSTNGRDGLSHYFRGVVYVTPETLNDLATSFLPRGVQVPDGQKGPVGSGSLPLGGLDKTLGGVLSGLPLRDPLNATGLTAGQEQNLLTQLLGGGQ
jgi:phospholipid/cholesterol/gamma-HCH transport system substrate-binding protein